MKKKVLALGMLAAALVGCENDYWVDFRVVTDADAGVIIDKGGIEIPEGLAAGVEAFPVEDGERKGYGLELAPTRRNIVGIDRGLEDNHFIIYGISQGSTEIDLIFDGEHVGTMPADVVPAAAE